MPRILGFDRTWVNWTMLNMCVYECICVCVVCSIGGGRRNVLGEIEEGRKSGGGRKGLLLVLPIWSGMSFQSFCVV